MSASPTSVSHASDLNPGAVFKAYREAYRAAGTRSAHYAYVPPPRAGQRLGRRVFPSKASYRQAVRLGRDPTTRPRSFGRSLDLDTCRRLSNGELVYIGGPDPSIGSKRKFPSVLVESYGEGFVNEGDYRETYRPCTEEAWFSRPAENLALWPMISRHHVEVPLRFENYRLVIFPRVNAEYAPAYTPVTPPRAYTPDSDVSYSTTLVDNSYEGAEVKCTSPPVLSPYFFELRDSVLIPAHKLPRPSPFKYDDFPTLSSIPCMEDDEPVGMSSCTGMVVDDDEAMNFLCRAFSRLSIFDEQPRQAAAPVAVASVPAPHDIARQAFPIVHPNDLVDIDTDMVDAFVVKMGDLPIADVALVPVPAASVPVSTPTVTPEPDSQPPAQSDPQPVDAPQEAELAPPLAPSTTVVAIAEAFDFNDEQNWKDLFGPEEPQANVPEVPESEQEEVPAPEEQPEQPQGIPDTIWEELFGPEPLPELLKSSLFNTDDLDSLIYGL